MSSARSNGGMMAIANTHKSLQDLERSLMIPNDPNAPNADAMTPPVPAEEEGTTVVTMSPGTTKVARRKKGEEQPTGIEDELLAEFVPETQLEVLHTRIPVWLNEALKDKLGPLERKNPKITKQALVTFCLIKALGVTPPPNFRLW